MRSRRPDMELARFLERLPRKDLWIFGYGSLMWLPGFRFTEKRVARLYGYHRSLCILSHRYRGTPRRPGLVMGLCRGGSCWGIAFRVKHRDLARVLAELWDREMRNRAYHPRLLQVHLQTSGSRRVQSAAALAFTADTDHPLFAGELGLNGRAQLVAQGKGERGRCMDYIGNTLTHLHALGLRDPHLARILATARTLSRG